MKVLEALEGQGGKGFRRLQPLTVVRIYNLPCVFRNINSSVAWFRGNEVQLAGTYRKDTTGAGGRGGDESHSTQKRKELTKSGQHPDATHRPNKRLKS